MWGSSLLKTWSSTQAVVALSSGEAEYYGMVNASTIAAAYASSGFYVFPSDKPETSGVNLMKAQATPTPAGRHSDPCIPPSQQLPICTGLALIDPVIWCRRRWEQYL